MDLPCVVCRRDPASIGLACEPCIDELWTTVSIAPEQVILQTETSTRAALVDRWGRAHLLPSEALIGRAIEQPGLAIIEGTVSRRHAVLTLQHDVWHVSDLGSANGTFLDGKTLGRQSATPLKHGAHLRFGRIALFFADNVDPAAVTRTVRVPNKTVPIADLSIGRMTTEIPKAGVPEELPTMTIRFHEPSGGGGGFIEIDGVHVQLTVPQFELVLLLVGRMTAEQDRPVAERGFVPTTELMTALSLAATMPADSHVRQVVLRLRRVLAKAGFENLIESRYGVGYRIRATPR